MSGIFFDEQAIKVIQSFQPYLGPKGSGCVMALEGLLDLLTSEQAEKAINAFRFLKSPDKFQMLDIQNRVSANNPFTLFLILILLILADQPGFAGSESVVGEGIGEDLL